MLREEGGGSGTLKVCPDWETIPRNGIKGINKIDLLERIVF